MRNYQEIERAAEQALNSLNNLQQLEANEYLHSKILQRMSDRGKIVPMAYNRLMLRLAAVLILFIGINITSFYVLKQRSSVATTKKATGADDFADAYSLNNNLDSY